MNKIFSVLGLLVGVMVFMCSCKQDETLFESENEETRGWHSVKIKFNISRAVFDQSPDGTRATDEGWKDGDVVYLLLTDKDGNKVQAYVQYDGSEDDWGEVMYDGYKSSLTCTKERVVEAYFIEGITDLQNQNISLSCFNSIYVCTNGSYVYPADGNMRVNVFLEPLTGRIRFEGVPGTKVAVGGLKTYTSFSRSSGEFSSIKSAVSATVEDCGSTPYLYAVFANEEDKSLIVESDDTYKTDFAQFPSMLQPGKSGFVKIPTSVDHREWYIPIKSVTLDKDTLFLTPGKTTKQLSVCFSPNNASYKGILWESSNNSVAIVDKNGMVSAVSHGTASITATSMSDTYIKATCEVRVFEENAEFTVNNVTFKMIYVEPGVFLMGSDRGDSNEQPVHSVTITKDYYFGETEVTQALWYAVMGYKPTSSGSQWSSSYGLGDNYPAYYISYEDVQEFLVKLNILAGQKFRMPTEAEWEFAARGGNKSKGYIYSGSNTIDDVAWYSSNKTHPVKTKAANELDIYDMGGNVWEWCSDWYGDYSSSAQTDPTGPATGSNRVKRGGSWGDYATYCRCANRRFNGILSDQSNYLVGFRLAL